MAIGKPWVYIASPYTKGDVACNVKFQHDVFNKLMDWGEVIPFAPLISHYHHIAYPRPWEKWLEYDEALLRRFDCLLRVNPSFMYQGKHYFEDQSVGADREAKFMFKTGKQVCYSIEDLMRWVREVWPTLK